MDSPRNPNLCEGFGDGRRRFLEDRFPSISEQNLQFDYMTTAQIDSNSMMQELGQLLHEGPSSRNNNSISGDQNPPVMNQRAAESTRQQQSGQRQPADRSSADSRSRIPLNITENATVPDRLVRKREADRKYREKMKDKQRRTESTVKTLEAEKQSLIKELDKLKKKYKKQREKREQMKSNWKTFEAEKESLKKENVLGKRKCETQLKELGKLRKKYNNLLAENGRLKDEIIQSLKKGNVLGKGSSSGAQSNEQKQVRSELENLKRQLASLLNEVCPICKIPHPQLLAVVVQAVQLQGFDPLAPQLKGFHPRHAAVRNVQILKRIMIICNRFKAMRRRIVKTIQGEIRYQSNNSFDQNLRTFKSLSSSC